MPSRLLTDTVLVQKCFLVRKDNKILTVKGSLSDEIWPGAWEFPGGGFFHASLEAYLNLQGLAL